MRIGRRTLPYAALAAVALGYFAPLAFHPSRTLYAEHSDLIALHVPWMTFLARSWRLDGELPLWNPLQFAGLPFAHDVQAAISYPPHAIFRWVGEGRVGAALSWLVVAHVVLAGWGMFAYARATGLATPAATVAAVGFMLAGKWMLHLLLAGHYAFAGLAWLPWVLLGLHRAFEQRSLLAATWAGLAFGLMALGTHPQLTLYAGLFLAAWTLPFALEAEPKASRIGRWRRWIGFGLWSALVAGLIAGVQVAPSLEAAALSSRGTAGLPEGAGFSGRALLSVLGPSPAGIQPVESWEPRSGFGVAWLAVAAIAPAVARGRDRRRAWWALGIMAGLAAFALGGAGLLRWLPFFKMFRMPARMFLVMGLPAAYLAGLATQGLLDRHDPATLRRARRIGAVAAGFLVVWLTVGAVASATGPARFHPYWPSLAATVPALVWLVRTGPGRSRRGWLAAWSAVLLVDLMALSRPYLRTGDLDAVLAPSAAARAVAVRAGPLDRVLDRNIPGHQSSTPLGPALAARLGLQSVRGYNPLDLVRTKEFLALASDPFPPRNPYNGLINAYLFHKPVIDLLGVRFLVQPADPDERSLPGEPDPDLDPSWRLVASDPAPAAFTFAAGGVRRLPAYEVLENRDAYPRAFVVPEAAPLPGDREGIVKAMTTTDFRRIAFVESPVPLDLGDGAGAFREARVASYRPNRVEVEAEGPGLLVLADPDYPGWVATVDGRPTPIVRADYLFRGVPLPPGRHAVALTFRPRSYLIGRIASLGTLATIVLATTVCLIWRKRPDGEQPTDSERKTPHYARRNSLLLRLPRRFIP